MRLGYSSISVAISAFVGASAFGAIGCGSPGLHTREGGAVTALSVTEVAWNPAKTPVGKVSAVAEAGEVACVFSDLGAVVFVSKAPVATDASVKDWTSAAAIPAPGNTTDIVGVSARGHVYRLRGRSVMDDVSDRFGLDAMHIRGVAVLGPKVAAFLADREIAVADGTRVVSYGVPELASLAGFGGFGAGSTDSGVYTFDLESKTARAFALPGVTSSVLTAKGKVVATTKRAVYEVDDGGALSLVYDAGKDTIHGLAVSGDNVWFGDGSELGVIENGKVAETSGVKIADDAKLQASTRGDVWVFGASGLSRFSRASAPVQNANGANGSNAGASGSSPSNAGNPTKPADPWTGLSSIFARSCSSCHLPNGISGTDLSTLSGWQSERANIHERIVVKKSMPPPGHPLSDADREIIRAWTDDPANASPAKPARSPSSPK